MPVVEAICFTDPFCPWSWAAEGALRRLETEFAGEVRVSFVTVGIHREIDAATARHMAGEVAEVSQVASMPGDPRTFLDDPPASTHPAGMAFHAVAEQTDPRRYLRRLREAVMLERRRMDRADALLDAARETGGIDSERLRVDIGSSGVLERFGTDVERARSVPEEARGPKGRVSTPSVEFRGADGESRWVLGEWRWEAWRDAALAAGAAAASPLPGVEDAVRRFGSITAAEVATLCGLPYVRASAELWRLALEFRVAPRRFAGGELWAPA